MNLDVQPVVTEEAPTAVATSRRPSQLTDAELEAMRQVMDPYADQLAREVLADPQMRPRPGSRLGYNRLIDLADHLETDAALLMCPGSNLAAELGQYSQEFQGYYAPMPAPAWVDPAKLELATKIWKNNTVATLGMLYAASLPACYLIKNGIPLLYQTAKLKDPRFITQRIYETGLMLDAVLSPGGLRLISDVAGQCESFQHFAEHLQKNQGGIWAEKDGKVARTDAPVASAGKIDAAKDQENAAFARQSKSRTAGKAVYLWGHGYLTAKKVRMLHASMRTMALNPALAGMSRAPHGSVAANLAQSAARQPWDSATLGAPVNQGDMAWTLLTFAYLIPRGLESIGCPLSRADKEAFLHLWRVIGHIMGLRDELTTDDWDEAEQLYKRLHRLQTGTSEVGISLTTSVIDFLQGYLPDLYLLKEVLPIALISQQLGREDTAKLLNERDQAILNGWRCRATVVAIVIVFKLYYWASHQVFRWVPPLKMMTDGLFERASDVMIASWRDGYARKPYWIPSTESTWVPQVGVDDAYRARLQVWRQGLFTCFFAAIGGAMLTIFALCAAGIFFACTSVDGMWWSLAVAGAAAAGTLYELGWRIPAVDARRPQSTRIRQVAGR